MMKKHYTKKEKESRDKSKQDPFESKFYGFPHNLPKAYNASHNGTQKAERRRSGAFWGPSLWPCYALFSY